MALDLAQGDLGGAGNYGIARQRRNVARPRIEQEGDRVRRIEQNAAERERLIIENGRNILSEMGTQYDMHINAAERQVELLRDREQRATVQLGYERSQAAANMRALLERARSTERRSQRAVSHIHASAQADVMAIQAAADAQARQHVADLRSGRPSISSSCC